MRFRLELRCEDIALALRVALGRNRKEKTKGAMTYTKKDSLLAHVEGALAEVAVARRWGVPIDERIMLTRGETGPDLEIRGRTVQIKSTTWFNKPLLRVEKDLPLSSEFYFCCYVGAEKFHVELVGFAKKSDLLKVKPRRLKPDLPINYILEEHELRQFQNIPTRGER